MRAFPSKPPKWAPPAAFVAGIVVSACAWYFGMVQEALMSDSPNALIAAPVFPALLGARAADFWDLIGVTVIACLGYGACLWALWQGFRWSFAAAIAGGALLAATFLPMNPLASPDVVHFTADVRTLWLHGRYPTDRDNVPILVDDPIAQQVVVYRNAPSAYGPIAYVVAGAALPFTGDGLAENVAGQKTVMAIALLLAAVGTGLLARSIGANPALAAGALALNPLMLTQYPGDGHNDAMLAAFGAFAMLFLVRRTWRERIPGVALGALSILTKFASGPIAAVFLAHWYPRWRPLFAVVFGATMALAVLGSIGLEERTGAQGPFFSVWDSAWSAAFSVIIGRDFERDLAVGAAFTTFLVVGSLIVLEHPLKTAQDVVAASGLLLGVFLFAGFAGYLPWYQIWYLPLALASGRRWLMTGAIAFSIAAWVATLARMYEPIIANQWGVQQPRNLVILGAWAIVALVTFLVWRHDRTQPPAERPLPAKVVRVESKPVPGGDIA